VSIKFHQLYGSSYPKPNSILKGNSFSLYCHNCKHRTYEFSRSKPRFFPIVTAVFRTLAYAQPFKKLAYKYNIY